MALAEHPIRTPEWIKALVENVLVDCVTPLGFMGPLGYRYWEPAAVDNQASCWQVAVYPTPNEVRGQDKLDGACYVTGFRFDVAKLIRGFSDVDELVWHSPAKYAGNLDGPELSVQGVFLGKRVWVRFFHLPPPDELPSYAVDPRTGVGTELPA